MKKNKFLILVVLVMSLFCLFFFLHHLVHCQFAQHSTWNKVQYTKVRSTNVGVRAPHFYDRIITFLKLPDKDTSTLLFSSKIWYCITVSGLHSDLWSFSFCYMVQYQYHTARLRYVYHTFLCVCVYQIPSACF